MKNHSQFICLEGLIIIYCIPSCKYDKWKQQLQSCNHNNYYKEFYMSHMNIWLGLGINNKMIKPWISCFGTMIISLKIKQHMV